MQLYFLGCKFEGDEMDLMHFFGVAAMVAVFWLAAFFQLPLIIWTTLIALSLVSLTMLGNVSAGWVTFFTTIFFIVAGFAWLPTWRRRHVTARLFAYLKQHMPHISAAELTAIEAGDTWWEKQLFNGKPDWRQLFAIPRPTLTDEEQHFLDNQVEQLCKMLDDWQIVHKELAIPESIWSFIIKEKFLGLVIPKQYGGLGFSALAHSSVIQKIASRSPTVAVSTMVPNSLGPAEMLLHYGTEEQKNYYLPKLASGQDIPCFALTAPEAGSDASAIPDTGIVCKGTFEGKEVIGIRLNWDKRYITLAPIATLLGLAFHLYDPDHLLSDKEDVGITLCLIPTQTPGVEIGTRHYPLFQAFMNGPTRGKDVFVPLDWIIGGSKMAGKGWKMLMESLSIGRSISLPALSTSCGKLAYRYTGAYARIRQQFNLPLSSFEGIQEALGYIAGYTYTLEACRMMTTGAINQGLRPPIASAIAKYHMTEMARNVVAHAMDIHAGNMIQMGPRNFLAIQHIAIPICITVEGANILTRNLIIFGQGAIRCHPYVLQEIGIMAEEKPNLDKLDAVLLSHIGYFVSNFSRSLFYGLTGGGLIHTTIKHRSVRKYQKQLTRMSSALAVLSDTSMILLGGTLKRRERISARLGDMLSQLYIASTVLKYFHDQGEPESDVNNVCWSLEEALFHAQVAIDGLFENFPSRIIAKMLSWCLFPFGRAYFGPKDGLHAAIIKPMLSQNAFRERLTQYCYKSTVLSESIGRLDFGLYKVDTIDPLWSKVQNAARKGNIPDRLSRLERIDAALNMGIITKTEHNALVEFEQLRADIIQVNEFSFDLEKVIA